MHRRTFLKLAAASAAMSIHETAASAPEEAAQASVVDGLENAADFITAEFAAGRFPGAAFVVERQGQTILERYWGTCATPERKDAPYDGNVFNATYSFGKAYTATVVVMAHQKGLLDYDVPVSTYIPAFKGGGKDAITLRHLLTHSAGLPSAPVQPVHSEELWNKSIAALCAATVEWAPGSRCAYHGASGALLAAEAVRSVCDRRPWRDICREWLFDPIESQATFDIPPGGVPLALIPAPERYPMPVDYEHLPIVGHPAGGAFSRPSDMLKLLRLHLNGGLWNGNVLIEPGAFREMHTVQYAREIAAAKAAGIAPVHEYWGLGWLLRGDTEEGWFGFGNRAAESAFGHAGIDAVMGIADPTRDAALVFITTASPGDASTVIRLRNTVTNLTMEALPATR